MPKIKADELSIFIETHKFIIRPNYKETTFKENDNVDVVHLDKNDYLVNNKEIWLVSSTLEEYSTLSPKILQTRKNYFKLYESSDISLIEDKLSKLSKKEEKSDKKESSKEEFKKEEKEEVESFIYDISSNPLVVESENSLEENKKDEELKAKEVKTSKPKAKKTDSKELKKEENIKSKSKTKK